MRLIISITFLLTLAECRRHLCDDGTRPICLDGTRAVYNRPTGENSMKSKYFPPPVCSGEGPAICKDGSTPKVRFNTCADDEKKCPKGEGNGPHDKPFHACADGSHCKCPGGGEGCKFRYKRCGNHQKCHKRCKSGVPHCPWFTKNRNPHNGTRIHNTGPNRPGNKEHHWEGDHIGNEPVDAGPLVGAFATCVALYDYYGGCSFLYIEAVRVANISRDCCSKYRRFRNNFCKCDCCYDDSTCIRNGPACDVPDGSVPTCLDTDIDWSPQDSVCPWQGPQRNN